MKIPRLGASHAHRWFECPGSPQASAVAPPIELDGPSFADEGTAAHKLFELCLRKKVEAEVYLGEDIKIERSAVGKWNVDEDMVEHVQAGVDLVNRKRGKGVLWLESPIKILTKPVATEGTLDAGWYGKYLVDKKPEWQLHTLDLKYGYLNVEVGGNVQLQIYALGKLKELLKAKKPVDSIHIWIYQPRSIHADGPFRHIRYEVEDLLLFESELQEKVTAVAKKPVRKAGSWCLHCGAHPTCPESERAALRIVRTKYHKDDTGRIGELFMLVGQVKAWCKSIIDLAETMKNNGTVPQGLKEVDGRNSRRWPGGGKSEEEKADQIKDMLPKLKKLGLKEKDIIERKLKSVAKIEKLLKKDSREDLEELYYTTRGKSKLVPIDDTRYALTAGLYFDDEDNDGLIE